MHARFADNRPTGPKVACGEAQICAAPGPIWEGTLLPVGTPAESQLAAARWGHPDMPPACPQSMAAGVRITRPNWCHCLPRDIKIQPPNKLTPKHTLLNSGWGHAKTAPHWITPTQANAACQGGAIDSCSPLKATAAHDPGQGSGSAVRQGLA